jgi:hypothetical protein
MKSSISYLKPPDCKSFSLDKPNLKRKGKKINKIIIKIIIL